ncbi:MAG: hypothetical protein R3Y24_00135 [Eubacteriales bacterium]
MNEIDFRQWLNDCGYSKKVESDTVSRLKRLERESEIVDIDDEFDKDQCEKLLSIFKNKGENETMKDIEISSLPIGNYQLSTYKYALKLYLKYRQKLS